MNRLAGLCVVAFAVAGVASIAVPAAARVDVGISIGVPAVGFDYGSGGYCDEWGCPDAYWDYPIFYGPVYWGGQWYRGPVYYREWQGRQWYWVHGSWRLDQWRGARPAWWGHYRYGRALGFEWYRGHGFRIPSRQVDRWRAHAGRGGWDVRIHDRDHDWKRDSRDRHHHGHDDWRNRNRDHDRNGGGMGGGHRNNNGGGMGGGHRNNNGGMGGGHRNNNNGTNNGGGHPNNNGGGHRHKGG